MSHRSNGGKHCSKTCGGGLCIYTHNTWCTNAAVIERHCSPYLEFLADKCRPQYLPWGLSVGVMAIYVPPYAKPEYEEQNEGHFQSNVYENESTTSPTTGAYRSTDRDQCTTSWGDQTISSPAFRRYLTASWTLLSRTLLTARSPNRKLRLNKC